MVELVYLTLFIVFFGAPNTQSARQTPKYCFLQMGYVYTLHMQHSAVQALPGGIYVESQSSLPPASSII
jgi:hypothetical protein